jgi:hypothetical protein
MGFPDVFPKMNGKLVGRKSWKTFSRQIVMAFRDKIISESGPVKISDGMVKLTKHNVLPILKNWGLHLLFWLGRESSLEKEAITSLSEYFLHVYKHSGGTFLAKKMKLSLFVINRYLADDRVSSFVGISEDRMALRNGLPAFLPLRVRVGIRWRNPQTIRWITSFLYAYKAFSVESATPDLSTITAPLADVPGLEEFQKYLPLFVKEIAPYGLPPLDLEAKCVLMTKAGPNRKKSIFGCGADAVAWQERPEGENHLLNFVHATGHTALEYHFNRAAAAYRDTLPEAKAMLAKHTPLKGRPPREILLVCTKENGMKMSNTPARLVRQDLIAWAKDPSELILGKISFKREAAGKMRPFAIVDYWTHMACRPIHLYLFEVLKMIPQDATFTQSKTAKEFGSLTHEYVANFDLKAATDLMPIQLVQSVLTVFFGDKVAQAWVDLMTKRDYHLPSPYEKLTESGSVRFSRGQPLGALSSWAALAITHHAVVRFAAFRNGLSHLTYELLGDDIGVSSKDLSDAYASTCQLLNIVLQPSKAIVCWTRSHVLCHFAQETWLNKINLSPVSLKKFLAISSLFERREYVWVLTDWGYIKNVLPCIVKGWCSPDMFRANLALTDKKMFSPHFDIILKSTLYPTLPLGGDELRQPRFRAWLRALLPTGGLMSLSSQISWEGFLPLPPHVECGLLDSRMRTSMRSAIRRWDTLSSLMTYRSFDGIPEELGPGPARSVISLALCYLGQDFAVKFRELSDYIEEFIQVQSPLISPEDDSDLVIRSLDFIQKTTEELSQTPNFGNVSDLRKRDEDWPKDHISTSLTVTDAALYEDIWNTYQMAEELLGLWKEWRKGPPMDLHWLASEMTRKFPGPKVLAARARRASSSAKTVSESLRWDRYNEARSRFGVPKICSTVFVTNSQLFDQESTPG